MKSAQRKDETIIKTGSANLQKNVESVGGKLHLTNQRLVFESHKFNIQNGVTEFDLSSIQTVERCWTKFLGVFPIFPNSLAIYTKQGEAYRFVLFDRGAWSAAIEANRHRANI